MRVESQNGRFYCLNNLLITKSVESKKAIDLLLSSLSIARTKSRLSAQNFFLKVSDRYSKRVSKTIKLYSLFSCTMLFDLL